MLFKRINLEFFKGGSSSAPKRDPKSAELQAMDTAVYNILSPIATRYGGSQIGGVTIPSSIPAAPGKSGSPTTPSWDSDSLLAMNYDVADQQAAATNANILDLLQSTPQYLAKHQAFMENGTDEGFENFLSGSEQAIANAYSKNVGTDLNNMASKGILNSSVTNRALANQQAETGNAIAANRNQGAGIWMDNYLSGYKTGMEGLNTQTKLPAQYYLNALAPTAPLYNYWKDMTNAYYGHEDYDTVVSSGK